MGVAHPRITDIWGPTTPYRGVSRGRPGWTPTWSTTSSRRTSTAGCTSACVLCSNGCGLDIAVSDGRMVGVRGREHDRVNHGRLGPKGLFGWQGQLRDRLDRPLVRRGGRLVETGGTRRWTWW